MEDDCIVVEEKDVLSGPPLKKLKQGRLPFTLLNVKTPQSPCLPPVQQKKRKHSGNEVTNKSLKNARQEKNLTTKQDLAKEELGYHKATEDEVSSSCDENIPDTPKDGKAVSNSVRKLPTLLQKFIKYEQTRQDEVSTSVGDDVDEEVVGENTEKRKSEEIDKEEDGKHVMEDTEGVGDEKSEDGDSGSTKREEKCVEVAKSGDCVTDHKSSQEVTKSNDETEDHIEASNEVDSTNISEEVQEVTPCKNSDSPQKVDGKDEVCTSQSPTSEDNPLHSLTKEEESPLSESISENQSPKDKVEGMEKLKTESEIQSEESSPLDGTNLDRDVESSPSDKDGVDGDKGSSPICVTPTSTKNPHILIVSKKLTPKQQMREADKQKKKEEKEKLRKKKEEEKLEKEKKKEAERNERERMKKEKEEEKIRQKEEKQKKKQEEQEMKVKEKQKKEEEKRQAEEEEKRKKNRLSAKFTSFFVKKQDASPAEEVKTQGPFMQFRVKENMRIAPLVRVNLSEEQYMAMDFVLEGTYEEKGTYLDLLQIKHHTPKTSERTWPYEEKRDDDYCEVIEEEDMEEGEDMIVASVGTENKPVSNVKAKLLQFCENQRPAYWGTWSKKTTKINARRPFSKDEDLFDYDYDSDDDWEEEEAGESLSDSEGEDKEEEEVDNQYEVDNDFFVPHGYLSDDEGKDDDSEGEEEKHKDKDLNREQERLKVKQAEFEEEMKKKTKQKKPRVFGCLWVEDKVNPAYEQLMKILNPYRAGMCAGHSVPVGTSFGGDVPKDLKESKPEDIVDDRQTTVKKFVKKFPEEAIKPLIQLIHGNRHGKQFLIREFGMYWKKVNGGETDVNETSPADAANTPKTPRTLAGGGGYISKKKMEMKINELGEWIRCPEGHGKGMMWFVNPEVRARYSAEDVVLPNTWDYNLKPKEHREPQLETGGPETPEAAKPSANLITRFTKVLTEEELKKNMSITQGLGGSQDNPQQTSEKLNMVLPSSLQSGTVVEESPSSTLHTPVLKKKVPLTSVPRIRDNHLVQTPSIKNFFKKDTGQTKTKSPKGQLRTSPNSAKVSTKNENDIECITLE